MAATAASAVGAVRLSAPEQWLLLAGWVVLYWLVHQRVARAERAGTDAAGQS
jgi:hypothetical protein